MTKFDKFVANFESFVLINEDASCKWSPPAWLDLIYLENLKQKIFFVLVTGKLDRVLIKKN